MRAEIIKVSSIKLGERYRKEYKNIRELASSIEKLGLIQPIAVKECEGGYELLAGGRRLSAIKSLGRDVINAVIYEEKEFINALKGREIELEENLQREDLTWQEEVSLKREILRLKQDLYGQKGSGFSESGVSERSLAEALGVSKTNLARDIRLAEAMDVLPIIKAAKTKSEALNLLVAAGKQMAIEEAATSLRRTEAREGISALKAKLDNSFIVKDVFEGMKDTSSSIISLLEVDPPFGINLKDMRKLEHRIANINLSEYNEVRADEYMPFMKKLFRECYRVLESDGWMLVWFGPEPWFEPIYSAIIEAGFICRRIPLIWSKTGQSGQTMQPDLYLANDYEMVFYARKTNSASLNKKGRSNVFSYPKVSVAGKVHPTEKPIELMMELIETFVLPSPDKVVMSPFAGSGNTLLAAANLGMSAIGFDLEQSYKNGFSSKILTQQYREYKSYV